MAPTDTYFVASYCCVEINKTIYPFANFKSLNDYLSFVLARIEPNVTRIGFNTLEEDILEYYIRYFPVDENITDAQYVSAKSILSPTLLPNIKESLKSAQSVGIDALLKRKETDLGGDVNAADAQEKC